MNAIIDELRVKLTALEAKALILKERDKQLEQMIIRCMHIIAEAMAWHEHYEGSISAAPWYCSMEVFRRELRNGPGKDLAINQEEPSN